MAGGFKRITDYDVVDPAVLPDDAVVYTVLPSEATPALIDRNWSWAGFKAFLATFVTAVADVVANTTHRSSDGSDHTFIDQDVKAAAYPTFAGALFTSILKQTGVLVKATGYARIQHGTKDGNSIFNALNGINSVESRGVKLTGSITDKDVATKVIVVSYAEKINSTQYNLIGIDVSTKLIDYITVTDGDLTGWYNCSISY